MRREVGGIETKGRSWEGRSMAVREVNVTDGSLWQ